VKLVRHKPTGTHLALKMLKKSEIVRFHRASHVCAERSILAELHHPYIIRLYVRGLPGCEHTSPRTPVRCSHAVSSPPCAELRESKRGECEET
jgi:serine/threonine protein kinase